MRPKFTFVPLLAVFLWACPSPPELQNGPRPGPTEGGPPPPPPPPGGGPGASGVPGVGPGGMEPGGPAGGLRGAQRTPDDAPFPEGEEEEEGQEADQYAIHDGVYEGSMVMKGTLVSDGTSETGECEMTLNFDHAEIEHEIQGTFVCASDAEHSSNFAQMHQAFGQGKLFGGVIDGEFKGDFWYGPINGTWSALLTNENTLTGGWSDRYEANDSIPQLPSFDHTGTFTLERK